MPLSVPLHLTFQKSEVWFLRFLLVCFEVFFIKMRSSRSYFWYAKTSRKIWKKEYKCCYAQKA